MAKPSKPASSNRAPTARVSNRLLASLPAADYARVARSIEVVPLKLKVVLHKPGEAVQDVFFPGGGFLSVLTVLQDGDMVEVATIGREGAMGVMPALDGGASAACGMVQAETDTCYRMPAEAFRREMNRRGAFYDVLTHYQQALVGFIMQSTACNAVHTVEQRLARWLLLASDRVENDEFPLTQEFAAMMLGASRPTVTIVAGTLQKAGLITYHRGQVRILDRKGLEAASCECYRTSTELLSNAQRPTRS